MFGAVPAPWGQQEGTVMSKPNVYPNSAITIDRPAAGVPSAVRPVVMVGTSGQHLTTELSELLRRRLRLATLIFLCGSAVFLLRNLIEGNHYTNPLHLAVHALCGAGVTLLGAVLWGHPRPPGGSPRVL